MPDTDFFIECCPLSKWSILWQTDSYFGRALVLIFPSKLKIEIAGPWDQFDNCSLQYFIAFVFLLCHLWSDVRWVTMLQLVLVIDIAIECARVENAPELKSDQWSVCPDRLRIRSSCVSKSACWKGSSIWSTSSGLCSGFTLHNHVESSSVSQNGMYRKSSRSTVRLVRITLHFSLTFILSVRISVYGWWLSSFFLRYWALYGVKAEKKSGITGKLQAEVNIWPCVLHLCCNDGRRLCRRDVSVHNYVVYYCIVQYSNILTVLYWQASQEGLQILTALYRGVSRYTPSTYGMVYQKPSSETRCGTLPVVVIAHLLSVQVPAQYQTFTVWGSAWFISAHQQHMQSYGWWRK